MEAGEARDSSSYAAISVAAADRLLRGGWWGLGDGEKLSLKPLFEAGLQVGVNLNFSRLGLRPYVVSGETQGGESLWDVANGECHAFRSYLSPSFGALMLATPPRDFDYLSLWNHLEGEGAVGNLTVTPMEEIRFLMAPVRSFNDQLRSFDFSWDDIGHRSYREAFEPSDYVPFGHETSAVLNKLMERPTVSSLGALSQASGFDVEICKEALAYVSQYPICLGFNSFEPGKHSGLLLWYGGLGEEEFWKTRSAIRDVPFANLEAWGREGAFFNYLVELVVPPQRLAETTDYLGKMHPEKGRLAYGFHDLKLFYQHSLYSRVTKN